MRYCEHSNELLLAKSQQKERFIVESLLGMASRNSFVAVGTSVTRRPPHRSVLAELLHTAPTADVWRRSAGWDAGEGSSRSESSM
jgi:hypothetical protein